MQIRYYWYSKTVINKVVRHTVDAEPITDWLYMQKESTDSGNVKANFYAYYPSINNGIFLTSRTIWDNDYSFIPSMQTECECFSSPEKYMEHLDWCVANAKWVGNAEIELAMQIDAKKANIYKEYRLDYLAKQEEKSAVLASQRKEKRDEQERIEKSNKEAIINAFLLTVKNGGKVNNANSVLIDVCNQFGVGIPIKLKGWIYKSLTSITFANGEAISYASYGSKSTTIFKYLKVLTDRIKELGNEPDEIITDDLKHLFGLDKK